MYRTITRHSILNEEINGNGQRLLGSATEINLVIRSGQRRRKEIDQETWSLFDGKMKTEIDHILIKEKDKRTLSGKGYMYNRIGRKKTTTVRLRKVKLRKKNESMK